MNDRMKSALHRLDLALGRFFAASGDRYVR
jgi:hypothetical protein